ncbi:MAG: NtrC family signal transduction histidine kinase [Burkholderiaceae bacterium]|nr:NtrC family signal transduction histidine kinase [Burkholderiaceae bacterium]
MKHIPPSSQELIERQSSPMRVVLAYAAFAALWIIASGAFLTISMQDQTLQGYLEVGKGLLFVVVTAALLHRLIKWHQANALRLTHLYVALSQCNQAIVHCEDEQTLFAAVCRAAVEHAGLRMAWVGFVDPATGQVRPVAQYGAGNEYLANLRVTVHADEPWGRGPTGTAIRERHAVWCQDFGKDSATSPWHDSGQQYGWRASASLPLLRKGAVIGAITLYAGRTNAFDSLARELLLEMADDVSFALERFELDETHKLAEQQARSAQALVQHFLDKLPGAAFIKDSDLRVLLANRGFKTVLGIDPASMIGKTNRELFPEPFASKISDDDRRVLATGKTETLGEELDCRHFETTKFVIESETGGKMIGGITIDVTQRHLLGARQQALLELNELGIEMSEAEFLNRGLAIAQRLTGSTLSFLHFISDDQQTVEVTACSEKAHPIACVADGGSCLVGDAGIWADCVASRRVALFNNYRAGIARGLPQSGERLIRLVTVPVIEDGLVRMVLGVGNKPADYDDADIVTLQLIGNDLCRIARHRRVEAAMQQQLADFRTLNQKLEETHNQLAQSEKMAAIGQLSAGIAHEINNPISFIQSNFSSLSSYLDDLLAIDAAYADIEKEHGQLLPQEFGHVRELKQAIGHEFIIGDLHQLIAESREGLERVRKIVQDLRNFSRVGETGWQWADLHEGISSTLSIVRSVIRPEVVIECEFGELPQVRCIPAQLNQVFLNLLVNAAQSIDGPGKVTLHTGRDGDQIWVEVRDNGSGIAPENMKRLFEPFFTTKPVGHGTGLGLSLSWGIVQRHNGRIEVDSEPGRGTMFRVVLPLDPLAEAAAGK